MDRYGTLAAGEVIRFRPGPNASQVAASDRLWSNAADDAMFDMGQRLHAKYSADARETGRDQGLSHVDQYQYATLWQFERGLSPPPLALTDCRVPCDSLGFTCAQVAASHAAFFISVRDGAALSSWLHADKHTKLLPGPHRRAGTKILLDSECYDKAHAVARDVMKVLDEMAESDPDIALRREVLRRAARDRWLPLDGLVLEERIAFCESLNIPLRKVEVAPGQIRVYVGQTDV